MTGRFGMFTASAGSTMSMPAQAGTTLRQMIEHCRILRPIGAQVLRKLSSSSSRPPLDSLAKLSGLKSPGHGRRSRPRPATVVKSPNTSKNKDALKPLGVPLTTNKPHTGKPKHLLETVLQKERERAIERDNSSFEHSKRTAVAKQLELKHGRSLERGNFFTPHPRVSSAGRKGIHDPVTREYGILMVNKSIFFQQSYNPAIRKGTIWAPKPQVPKRLAPEVRELEHQGWYLIASSSGMLVFERMRNARQDGLKLVRNVASGFSVAVIGLTILIYIGDYLWERSPPQSRE